jgi:HK97 family phage major capsid protein/HK97 family phage prohead protease
MLNRAYSLLEIRSVDETTRRIRGVATTPTPDRLGDIIEPLGATYAAEIPLLLHHRREAPVGIARLAPATKDGIAFEADIPRVDEPGPVKDETDRAWQSIKHGLIRAVSVGFKPRGAFAETVERMKDGGLKFLKTEILELSLVTVPANQQATLALVKSLDQAAMGHTLPGVAGATLVVRAVKAAPAMTIAEQITQWSNTRAPKADEIAALMKGAADTGVTLDAPQAEKYDTLKAEIKSIDEHLARLREMETLNKAAATPVVPAPSRDPLPGQVVRPSVIQVKSQLPQGTAFVRAACAVLVCRGNFDAAANYARGRWADTSPEVETYLRAAVAAGNTTDAAWAGPLVSQGIASDFIELLRPATILGKIPNLRSVPFNTKVPSQTAGGTYGWVGEAKPKPVTKLAFSSVLLDIAKAAGIIVLTEELVRLSNPSAEALVRADMVAGIAQFLDAQFIDPAVAAVAGVNPASITNGAPTAAATTSPLADLLGLIAHFSTNNIPVNGLAFIMSPANALAWSFYTSANGDRLFPSLTMDGGSVQGITVVTSQAAATNVIALQPQLILYADDGGVTIDASREASLQMDSAPMSPADATTVMVSLWQNNLVGLRAERFVNWKRAMTNAVKYLTAAAYPAPSALPTTTPPPGPGKDADTRA